MTQSKGILKGSLTLFELHVGARRRPSRQKGGCCGEVASICGFLCQEQQLKFKTPENEALVFHPVFL